MFDIEVNCPLLPPKLTLDGTGHTTVVTGADCIVKCEWKLSATITSGTVLPAMTGVLADQTQTVVTFGVRINPDTQANEFISLTGVSIGIPPLMTTEMIPQPTPEYAILGFMYIVNTSWSPVTLGSDDLSGMVAFVDYYGFVGY